MKTVTNIFEEIKSKKQQIRQLESEIDELKRQKASACLEYAHEVIKKLEAMGHQRHPIAKLGIQTVVYNLSFIYREDLGFKLENIKIRNRRQLNEESHSDLREMMPNVFSLNDKYISDDPELQNPSLLAEEINRLNEEVS